jgi:hypothetical protein
MTTLTAYTAVRDHFQLDRGLEKRITTRDGMCLYL